MNKLVNTCKSFEQWLPQTKHCINVSFYFKILLIPNVCDFTIVFYTVKLTIKCRIKTSYLYLWLKVSMNHSPNICIQYLPTLLRKVLFINRSNVLLFSASNILFICVWQIHFYKKKIYTCVFIFKSQILGS